MTKSSVLHFIFDMADKKLKAKGYYMMDNILTRDSKFNDSEFRLLAYYQSFTDKTGTGSNVWNVFDTKTRKDLQWSKGKLDRTKRKLKDKGYLAVRQVGATNYQYFFGRDAVKDYNEAIEKSNKKMEENSEKLNKNLGVK